MWFTLKMLVLNPENGDSRVTHGAVMLRVLVAFFVREVKRCRPSYRDIRLYSPDTNVI